MEQKYVSRSIPVTSEKLAVLEEYRRGLQEALGFKVSLSDAIVHAVKTATAFISKQEATSNV